VNEFIVATSNMGKLKEIREVLESLHYNVISMREAGIEAEIEETGKTFEENALIKAHEVHKITGKTVMADDSGLVVDCLDGAPGIYSSRFAGENASDQDRVNKLLSLLEGTAFEQRTARFVCAIAVVFPDRSYFTVQGTCEGHISHRPEGKNGFGYDPVFFVDKYEKTMAELDPADKNLISHRGKALKLMLDELSRYYAKREG